MKTGFYARHFEIISGPNGNQVRLSPIDPEAMEIMDLVDEELVFDKAGLLQQLRITETEVATEMPTNANIQDHPDVQTLQTAYGALVR